MKLLLILVNFCAAVLGDNSYSDIIGQCPDGREVLKFFECNGVDDCGDGSEEVGCIEKECGHNFFCDEKTWRGSVCRHGGCVT